MPETIRLDSTRFILEMAAPKGTWIQLDQVKLLVIPFLRISVFGKQQGNGAKRFLDKAFREERSSYESKSNGCMSKDRDLL